MLIYKNSDVGEPARPVSFITNDIASLSVLADVQLVDITPDPTCFSLVRDRQVTWQYIQPWILCQRDAITG